MSAYVVADETINRVVSWLASHSAIAERFERAGINLKTHAGQSMLAVAMFQLNCNAVEQRYGKGQAASFRPLNFKYRVVRVSATQAYKSLRCWLYQCTEGDVPETSSLYAVMEQISDAIEASPEYDSGEYDSCKWS